MRIWREILNWVGFLRELWKRDKNGIFVRLELGFVWGVGLVFFMGMGNREFLNLFEFLELMG